MSGVGAAFAYTSVRELRKFYDTRAIVLSFMAIGTIGPIILMIIGSFYSNPNLDFMLGTFVMPQTNDWFYDILPYHPMELPTFALLFPSQLRKDKFPFVLLPHWSIFLHFS